MSTYITKKHRIVELLAYIVIAVALILTTIYAIQHSAETVPTHYNWKGEVDGWGSALSALILPGAMLAVNILISLISHFCPPSSFNIPVKVNWANAAAVYGDSLMMLFLLELELSLFCLLSGLSYLFDFAENFGWSIFVLLSAVFITITVELILTVKHNNA